MGSVICGTIESEYGLEEYYVEDKVSNKTQCLIATRGNGRRNRFGPVCLHLGSCHYLREGGRCKSENRMRRELRFFALPRILRTEILPPPASIHLYTH